MKTAKKILAAIFLMGTLVLSLMALTSCTGNEEPTDPAYYQIDKFEIDKDNKLIVITGGGRRISAGNLPSNPSNLKLVDAYVDDGYIWVNVSGYLHRCSLPELNKDNRINSVRINSDGHLVFKTTSGDFDAGLIFLPTMPNSPLTPSGASEYASRDTSENDTATVKIKVQGYGEITILVDKTVSPTAAEKFISLAKAGKYDGITFSMMLADKLFYSEAADSELAPPSAFEVMDNPIENKKGTVGLILDDEGNITSKLYFTTADLSSEYDGLLLPFGYVINGMNIVTEINELTAPYSNPLFNYEIDDEQRRAAIESITVVDNTDPGDNTGPGDDAGPGDNTGSGDDAGSGDDGSDDDIKGDMDDGGWT